MDIITRQELNEAVSQFMSEINRLEDDVKDLIRLNNEKQAQIDKIRTILQECARWCETFQWHDEAINELCYGIYQALNGV